MAKYKVTLTTEVEADTIDAAAKLVANDIALGLATEIKVIELIDWGEKVIPSKTVDLDGPGDVPTDIWDIDD